MASEQKRLYPFLYANPPKGWTGHIPENWREEIKMANKHEHRFELGPMEESPVCAVCGVEAVDLVPDLQQQLAASDRQQATLQEALDSSLAMQQEDEQTIDDARALIIDYIAAITRRAPELAAEPASALFSLDDQVATHLYQQMRTWLEKHPAPGAGGLEADDDE